MCLWISKRPVIGCQGRNYGLHLAKTSEYYVRVVMDMYDGARTVMRNSAGLTEEFEVGVGLHQGSALSSFLFAIVMDKLTEEI